MAMEWRLLVVDDDPRLTGIVALTAAQLGILTRECNDPRLALDAFVEFRPDVVMIDIYMPELDGWGFLQQFAEIRDSLIKKIEVCIITSSNHPRDRERAESLNFVKAYVQKPITLESLKEIIN